jgi:hypothetical protein
VEVSTPLQTYTGLYAHVLKLTSRAIGRRWPYLFIAPVVGILYGVITFMLGRMFPVTNTASALVFGLIQGLLQAAAVSCVLFVGRALIEQRQLTPDDLTNSFGVFFWDIVNVYFYLFAAAYVIAMVTNGRVNIPLDEIVPAVLPVFEIVALTTASRFGVFEEAWRFVRRDAFAWIAGHLPLLILLPTYLLSVSLIYMLLGPIRFSPFAVGLVLAIVPAFLRSVLLLVAFVYRGILYLTLDNTSPRARAERFGGVPSLR